MKQILTYVQHITRYKCARQLSLILIFCQVCNCKTEFSVSFCISNSLCISPFLTHLLWLFITSRNVQHGADSKGYCPQIHL
jgi:hypothetical protein